jgi:hypothetical protein
VFGENNNVFGPISLGSSLHVMIYDFIFVIDNHLNKNRLSKNLVKKYGFWVSRPWNILFFRSRIIPETLSIMTSVSEPLNRL